MAKDLTQGRPIWLLFTLGMPILIGNLFQQFYSMVDTIIVGRFVGQKAMAAVGCTGSISFFILGAAFGLTAGFAIIVAQLYGGKQERELRNAVAVSIELSALFSLAITAVSVIFATPILEIMQTPEDIFHDAYLYIVIIFWGIPGMVYYNLFSGILRAVGDSRTPLVFLMIASVGNILLDLLLVVVIPMGPAGAALATIVSQTLSGIGCLFYMFRRYQFLIPHGSDWHFSPSLAWSLVRLGVPSALSNSVCAIGCMAVQGAVNRFGSDMVAGYTAGTKIEGVATQPCFAFSSALINFVGQNVGAGKMDRVRKGTHDCLKLMLGCAVFGFVVAQFCGKALVGVFLEAPTAEVIDAATRYLRWISYFVLPLGVLLVYRCAISGMGNANIPMLSGAVELAMRLPIAFFLSVRIGYTGICQASPASWIAAAIMLCIAYYQIERSTCKRFGLALAS